MNIHCSSIFSSDSPGQVPRYKDRCSLMDRLLLEFLFFCQVLSIVNGWPETGTTHKPMSNRKEPHQLTIPNNRKVNCPVSQDAACDGWLVRGAALIDYLGMYTCRYQPWIMWTAWEQSLHSFLAFGFYLSEHFWQVIDILNRGGLRMRKRNALKSFACLTYISLIQDVAVVLCC